MPPISITPEYTLLLRYDVRPGLHEHYFRYVVGEFVPLLQERGVYMQDAWHVAYGNYPERQVEFITEELETIRNLFADPVWHRLEETLNRYVINYQCNVYRYQGVFKI